MNIYILNKQVPNTEPGEGPGQNNKGWGLQGHKLRIRGAFFQVPTGVSFIRVVIRERSAGPDGEVFIDETFEAVDQLTEEILAGDFTFPIGLDVVPFDVDEVGLDVYVRGGTEDGRIPAVKYATVRVALDMVSAT